MSPRARAVFEALLPGAADARLERFLGTFRKEAPTPLRLALPAAVFAAAWLSPLLVKKLPPLTRLRPSERERALAAMLRSESYLLRQLVLLLKLVMGMSRGAA